MKFLWYLIKCILEVSFAAVGVPTEGATKEFIIGLIVVLIVGFLWFAAFFTISNKTTLKEWLCVLSAIAVTIVIIAAFSGISILVEWLFFR